jgi:hypothetical protein
MVFAVASIRNTPVAYPVRMMMVIFCKFRTAGQKTISPRNVLRAAISTQVSLVFLCLQANAEMATKFPVATACFHAALHIYIHQSLSHLSDGPRKLPSQIK